jgi:hypothetical protein
MDIYFIYKSLNNIYNQLNKDPSDIDNKDLLVMMDPFFITEMELLNIEYKKINKRRIKRGGSSESNSNSSNNNLESSNNSELNNSDNSDNNNSDNSENSENNNGLSKAELKAQRKEEKQQKKAEKLQEKREKKQEKIKEDLEVSTEQQMEKMEEEERAKKRDPKANDASASIKKMLYKSLKVLIILALIGGGPFLPWILITYYTFKKLSSSYRYLITPM